MKFKGIEWEECNRIKFMSEEEEDWMQVRINERTIYLIPKQKKCSKCG